MLIEKALKKENKAKKRFYVTMFFLGISVYLVAYLANVKSVFVWIYVAILELLILLAVLRRYSYYELKYALLNNRLKIKSGVLSKDSFLFCDKIVMVHTEKKDNDIEIIIISAVKFKNNTLKPVTKGLIKRYPAITTEYLKLQKKKTNEIFYFQIIRRGALKKYILLELIYRNCVNAVFTNEAIESVKIARNQIDIKER